MKETNQFIDARGLRAVRRKLVRLVNLDHLFKSAVPILQENDKRLSLQKEREKAPRSVKFQIRNVVENDDSGRIAPQKPDRIAEVAFGRNLLLLRSDPPFRPSTGSAT